MKICDADPGKPFRDAQVLYYPTPSQMKPGKLATGQNHPPGGNLQGTPSFESRKSFPMSANISKFKAAGIIMAGLLLVVFGLPQANGLGAGNLIRQPPRQHWRSPPPAHWTFPRQSSPPPGLGLQRLRRTKATLSEDEIARKSKEVEQRSMEVFMDIFQMIILLPYTNSKVYIHLGFLLFNPQSRLLGARVDVQRTTKEADAQGASASSNQPLTFMLRVPDPN